VSYQGQECGTVRRYSDTLSIFLLKGAMPEKYEDRVEQHFKGKAMKNSNVSPAEAAAELLKRRREAPTGHGNDGLSD